MTSAAPDSLDASHATHNKSSSQTRNTAGLRLIDLAIEATVNDSTAQPLQRFVETSELEQSLAWYFELSGFDDVPQDMERLARRINHDIARLDQVVNRQLNAILHHPRFQQLEASWRGLYFLVDKIDGESNAKIRVLDVSWHTLKRDFDKSIEFDQSQLFRKVYSEEFGISGGEPFSVLLGDYDVRPRPGPGDHTDDIETLRSISQVAAAGFAPFITSAHPAMFGLYSFSELERPMNLERIFDQPEYVKWRRLRDASDSRFLALTMPRVLMRAAYENDGSRADSFTFVEDVAGQDSNKYLWGNAIYAFGSVLLRAFNETRWLADIRGLRRDSSAGGLVEGLPTERFRTDGPGVANKISTDVALSSSDEHELSRLGFLPLCPSSESEASVFYSTTSIQRPKKYDDEFATANARISAMLHYMLCVARIAHYIKVMGRDKVGSFMEASDCETFLNQWLRKFVMQNDDATSVMKAKFPLRDANVQVRSNPGKPGSYYCVISLQPHFQLDELATAIQLSTELTPAEAG